MCSVSIRALTMQKIAATLSDCGVQIVLLEQRLVAEHPEVVAMCRGLTSAPLILMFGSRDNCDRWGLDAYVVRPECGSPVIRPLDCHTEPASAACSLHIPSTLQRSGHAIEARFVDRQTLLDVGAIAQCIGLFLVVHAIGRWSSDSRRAADGRLVIIAVFHNPAAPFPHGRATSFSLHASGITDVQRPASVVARALFTWD